MSAQFFLEANKLSRKEFVSRLDLTTQKTPFLIDAVTFSQKPIDFGVVPGGTKALRTIALHVNAPTYLNLKIKGDPQFKAVLLEAPLPDTGKPPEYHAPILVDEYVPPIDIISGTEGIFFHTGEFRVIEADGPRLTPTEIQTLSGKRLAFQFGTHSFAQRLQGLPSMATELAPPPAPPPLPTPTATADQLLFQNSGIEVLLGEIPPEDDNVFPESNDPYYIEVSFAAPKNHHKSYSANLIVSFDDTKIEIPLSAQTGMIDVSLQSSNAPTVQLGDSVGLTIEINNWSNTPATLSFPEQTENYGISVPAQSWTIPANQVVTRSLLVNTDIASFYNGELPLELIWSAGFGKNSIGDQVLNASLILAIKPPSVQFVSVVTAFQGEETPIGVTIVSHGPATTFYFQAEGLPDGVTMPLAQKPVMSGKSVWTNLSLNVAPHTALAPASAGLTFKLNYSAYGGLFKGSQTVGLIIDNTFKMQPQEQSMWCWSAVTVSLLDYFGGKMAQCTLVDRFYGPNCCTSPAACNKGEFIQNSLNSLGMLAGIIDRPLTAAEIIGQIDANRPVMIHIKWAGGGAHAIAITGYVTPGTGGTMFIVEDPGNGSSQTLLDLPTLTSNYGGSGVWKFSYLTQPPPPVVQV